MDSYILNCCDELDSVIKDNRKKYEILNECAKEKMLKIFNNENDEYDKLINKIEINLDYNEYAQVKQCVTKLLKMLSKNRKNLILNLERLCS